MLTERQTSICPANQTEPEFASLDVDFYHKSGVISGSEKLAALAEDLGTGPAVAKHEIAGAMQDAIRKTDFPGKGR